MTPAAIFANFEGSWHFTRRITDCSSEGLLAEAQGQASFSRRENCLHYHEEGTLELAGQSAMRFAHDHYYSLVDGQISLFFDPRLTRFYHTIDFSKTPPQGVQQLPLKINC